MADSLFSQQCFGGHYKSFRETLVTKIVAGLRNGFCTPAARLHEAGGEAKAEAAVSDVQILGLSHEIMELRRAIAIR